MLRRHFIKSSSIQLAGISAGLHSFKNFRNLNQYKDLIIGHGTHQYKIDMNWGALDPAFYPVNDCHEMVQDAKGRIIMLTNHTKNNVIIYDQSGKLIEVWGTEFPGAHGLTLHQENGEEFLYITDTNRHEVIKTTIDGKVVMVLDYPKESGKYDEKKQYVPTETAIAENGDIYVADGYGMQYIMQYNAKGELLNVFGGRGEDDPSLDNAHGIAIDYRKASPILLITDRNRNELKRYSMDGNYLSKIELPGAYICRPVIHNQHIYIATIWSNDRSANTGFISILNEKDQLISAPGGSQPKYENGQLNHMHQTLEIFKHPHDVCVDENEDIYVCQWNSGQSYPIKLLRV